MREDSLRGVTSNPAIFEKAILGSDDYDEQIGELAGQGLDAKQIYEQIAITDVQLACDVLRPVWDGAGGADGFVSLEVEPGFAHDADATLAQARDFWQRVDRPNLMIKIPGTDEGAPAIEEAVAGGINVNVTLLFSVESYARDRRGLHPRHGAPARRGRAARPSTRWRASSSRASTPRWTSASPRAPTRTCAGSRPSPTRGPRTRRSRSCSRASASRALRDAGCPVQRPLWASTGVKDPRYPETKYVDSLVAPHTVNTMPMPTLLACEEQLEVTGATADQDPTAELSALADAGIDMGEVTAKLLREGIEKFVEPFDKLIAGVELTREGIVTGRPPTIASSIPDDLEPALIERIKQAQADSVARRIWQHDESLWGGPGVPEIANRLGWLTISEKMLEHAPALNEFVAQVKADGFTDAVLLGMGGSSLGPEVIRRSYGQIPDGLRLHVLDSTDPGAVLDIERIVDLDTTLFIVSSKSGGTIETLSHMRYFYERVGDGKSFVAITDPGSPLIDLANERGFRHVFENDPDIGGRYSVLSYFGIVPAALAGVNVEAMLHRSQVAEQNCAQFGDGPANSGLWLGVALGELALQGRDKATFVVSKPIESFGLWVEQLIAESTGKHGKGILPVAGEPLGKPDAYGDDRVFVYLRDPAEPDAEQDKGVEALARAGHPTITVAVHGAADLGRIFFFSEFAVAVAGWALGINPFDQPNVQEAKDNTAKVLAAGDLPEVDPGDPEDLFKQASPPHYVAIMAYVNPSDEFDAAIEEMRARIRDHTKATTTFGYGPRFLHSTGQYHKGGPPTGLFLQFVHDGAEDAEIPEAGYGFRHLKNAQAIGDLQTLRAHGLPAVQIRLEGDPADAVRRLP